MKKIVITSFTIAALFAACKSTKETSVAVVEKVDCSTYSGLTYSKDIKTIIETNCAKCHNKNNKAGFNFLTLESVKKGVSNGELLGTIKHQKGYPKMPIGAPKLSQDDINKIECWINSGMPE
jgi:mono/diheme cytochrome c family protein